MSTGRGGAHHGVTVATTTRRGEKRRFSSTQKNDCHDCVFDRIGPLFLAFSDNVARPRTRAARCRTTTRVSVCSLRTVTGSRSPRWWTMTPRRSRRRYALGPLRAFGTASVLPRAGAPSEANRASRPTSLAATSDPPTRVPTLPRTRPLPQARLTFHDEAHVVTVTGSRNDALCVEVRPTRASELRRAPCRERV